ncbi:cadmium resistance transporter [Labrenzia sp. DG1229]|uniref:cadmium resistance transporter n=1 Tax=Labrenzia sp. DG1229 TaxID=681847 RepID=UPI00048F39F1|nr:cadmium resistance transporter [Labrenzia sp. DG1229]
MLFALSIALAYALTNIDGLFAFFAIATSGRYRQALIGFLLAQLLVVTGAYIAGAGVALVPPHALGYLGLVPLSLGVWEVWRNMSRSGDDAETLKSAHSVFSAAMIFLALSADTFILIAAFFADTAAVLDMHVLLGALIAVAGLVIAGTLLTRSLGSNRRIQRFFENLSPFVMIAAGIYILLDTATDAL